MLDTISDCVLRWYLWGTTTTANANTSFHCLRVCRTITKIAFFVARLVRLIRVVNSETGTVAEKQQGTFNRQFMRKVQVLRMRLKGFRDRPHCTVFLVWLNYLCNQQVVTDKEQNFATEVSYDKRPLCGFFGSRLKFPGGWNNLEPSTMTHLVGKVYLRHAKTPQL